MCSVLSHWKKKLGNVLFVSPGLQSGAFPFADFNLYHFTVINYNQEYNHFSESYVSF